MVRKRETVSETSFKNWCTDVILDLAVVQLQYWDCLRGTITFKMRLPDGASKCHLSVIYPVCGGGSDGAGVAC